MGEGKARGFAALSVELSGNGGLVGLVFGLGGDGGEIDGCCFSAVMDCYLSRLAMCECIGEEIPNSSNVFIWLCVRPCRRRSGENKKILLWPC